ncbi:MAG: Uma2 family endonuclease [Cyanobacteria bacterium P01_F01_bin.143]
MFVTEKINLTEDHLSILTGVTWDDYEKLDIPENNSYLISYLNNEITIMSPGRNHERIAETIGMLIEAYCDRYDIDCFPFGSTRLEEKGLEAKEPDTSYAFKTDKNKPDLAVEVIFTSGSLNDLIKYKYLKIKEVWLWQNNQITFYKLENNNYKKIEESFQLKGIKSQSLIEFVNRGFSESTTKIRKDFVNLIR